MKQIFFFIIILSFSFLFIVFAHYDDVDIQNGDDAKRHEYPFIVFLKREDSTKRCSGTLLMPDLVMTADHCVSHGKAIKVIAGAHDITTEEASQQIIRVTKRRYVRLRNDDVALIKLPKSFDINSYVKTIRIQANFHCLHSKNFWMAGWGRTAITVFPNSLKKAMVNCLNKRTDQDCLTVTKPFHECFANRRTKQGACGGDSGSPTFVKAGQTVKVVGVISAAPAQCEEELQAFSDVITSPYICPLLQEKGYNLCD